MTAWPVRRHQVCLPVHYKHYRYWGTGQRGLYAAIRYADLSITNTTGTGQHGLYAAIRYADLSITNTTGTEVQDNVACMLPSGMPTCPLQTLQVHDINNHYRYMTAWPVYCHQVRRPVHNNHYNNHYRYMTAWPVCCHQVLRPVHNKHYRYVTATITTGT